MSAATLKATSVATVTDKFGNILGNLEKQMNVFDRVKHTFDNLSSIGTITDVTFAQPIEDMISDMTGVMEVYPPRCMVTYRQLIP